MTLNEFIQKYTGKKLDFDGAYDNQCVDLYRFYVREVWQKPQTPRVVGAHQILKTLPSGYDKFTSGIPQPGDVIVWNENQVKNGHVAVVVSATPTSFRAFQQNAPNVGQACNTASYTYRNVIGWFRPTPKPMKTTKKVLVLFSQIDQQNITEMKQGIQAYVDVVKTRTNDEFNLDVSYAEIDRRFHTVAGTSTDGARIVFAVPSEIGEEGHKVELATGKEFDTVCLIYNNETVYGEQPTNPVENPITLEGFNPIQIPLNWLKDGDTAWATSLFFAHENSHSDYYIVNSEGGLALYDKTHDQYNQTPEYGPMQRFCDLLIELKPYWHFLGSSGAQGQKPMNTYKFSDNPTEYILTDNGTLIPMTAAGLTKTLAGRPERLVTLAPADRNKYTIVSSIVN